MGMDAYLAPKPFENQPGNGCHLHISAWDIYQERNLLFAEKWTVALWDEIRSRHCRTLAWTGRSDCAISQFISSFKAEFVGIGLHLLGF